MIRSLQGRSWVAVFAIVASWSGTAAFGQGNTFNPYGNSGYADYREFTTPMYSNDPSLPGQARLQSGLYGGQSRANQFESYANSLDRDSGELGGSARTSTTGVPYYRANQIYDKENKRTYRPNDNAADRQFRERIAQRNAAYSQALEEKDPRVRAQKLQRIERDALVSPAASTPKSSKTVAPRAATGAVARTPAAATPTPRPSTAPARPVSTPAATAPVGSAPPVAPTIPIPAPPR